MKVDVKTRVKVLKALADETRLHIVQELAKHRSLSCSQLSDKFSLAQPTLSHHFKKLVDVEIIAAEKKATHMVYSLNRKYLKHMGILF